ATSDVNLKREAILKALCIHLGEDDGHLIREYMGGQFDDLLAKGCYILYSIVHQSADGRLGDIKGPGHHTDPQQGLQRLAPKSVVLHEVLLAIKEHSKDWHMWIHNCLDGIDIHLQNKDTCYLQHLAFY
ncbi:Pre-mRNA-splicing factor ATP-dependent RNA helicase DEAH1, partial [Dissostichus eleginoides]